MLYISIVHCLMFDVSYSMFDVSCVLCHVCFKVVDVLNASLASWADATNGPVQFVMKGQNILTEMYVNK